MLLWRSKPSYFTVTVAPFSLGNFVEHLPPVYISSRSPRFKLSSIQQTRSVTAIAAQRTSLLQTLTSQQQQQVELYIHTLLQWNQKMNLTAVKDEDEAMERHVEDSLAIIEPIKSSYLSRCGDSCEDLKLVDVGSGAGLPGIILAIACPGWKLTLLESMQKRCVFLEHAVNATGLSNVEVIRDRAENSGHDPATREVFDVAVARAVAEMRILAEYCLPLVRVGGLFVAAKGHDTQEEVERAERAIKLMGASVFQTFPVNSHSKYGQRTAIVCVKEGTTPRKYPRAPGTPAKSPL